MVLTRPGPDGPRAAGVLLAAGAGRRMGTPKALVRDDDGTSWLVRSAGVLAAAGCDPVVVVLGAAADEARTLVPAGAEVVVADDWDDGMSASLRAGIAALRPGTDVAVVTLVDLPDVTADVVRRVLDAATADGPSTLARAVYDGRPGHPVLIGRDHWAGVLDPERGASGDAGARDYLRRPDVVVRTVECGDLASGHDVDRPPA